jgi:hypothetical protein
VVLFKIDAQGLAIPPLEGDTPRPVDVDRVASWAAAQGMEVESGLRERFNGDRLVDCLQAYQGPPLQIGAHPAACAGFEQLS